MKMEELWKELRQDQTLRSAAASPEAGRLLDAVDPQQAERAVRQGDAAELKRIMGRVLSTPEGRALAERVRKAVGKG